ncbi:MAG: hypothetical protein SOZ89_02660 [Peptoniphilaceae bacterium]|nr:hypothetical protein [Peptoniphilaceae bacterium]MDD7383864.1 hypothetical protein [Peptoniphilaceae bacterium]MDY3738005.1 hypothetical protein [Peptoniphilaceae bacterium]
MDFIDNFLNNINQINLNGFSDIINTIGFINQDLLKYVAIFGIIFLILLILLSSLLWKTGTLLLAITFILDNALKFLDLYSVNDNLKLIINILYVISFAVFVFKILKFFRRDVKGFYGKEKTGGIFNFTGSLPFLIVMIISSVDTNNFIPSNIKLIFINVAFIYMIFKTLFNTYKYIKDEKESLSIKGESLKRKLSFNIPKLNSKAKITKKDNETSKNFGRIRKPSSYSSENKNSDTKKSDDFIKENEDELKKDDLTEKNITREISYSDLFYLVTRDFNSPMNTTKLSITNLNNGMETGYISKKCICRIKTNDEYLVELEFKDYNDYDYGKFVDILRTYMQDKNNYKFQLELMPAEGRTSKIVLFDPSEIIENSDENNEVYQGKILKMIFQKYKINFTTGVKEKEYD